MPSQYERRKAKTEKKNEEKVKKDLTNVAYDVIVKGNKITKLVTINYNDETKEAKVVSVQPLKDRYFALAWEHKKKALKDLTEKNKINK